MFLHCWLLNVVLMRTITCAPEEACSPELGLPWLPFTDASETCSAGTWVDWSWDHWDDWKGDWTGDWKGDWKGGNVDEGVWRQ